MIDWSQRGSRLEQIKYHWHELESYDPDTIPFLLNLVDELSLDLGIAKDLLWESLKFGEHDGECDNDYDNGPCYQHVLAGKQREELIHKFLRGEPLGDFYGRPEQPKN